MRGRLIGDQNGWREVSLPEVHVHGGYQFHRVPQAAPRTPVAGPERAARLLILGASNAWGWDCTREATCWWWLLGEALDADVIVRAVPGSRAEWAAQVAPEEIARWKPDLTLYLGGTNDLARGSDWRVAVDNLRRLGVVVAREPSIAGRNTRTERRLAESILGRPGSAAREAKRLLGERQRATADIDLSGLFDAEPGVMFTDGAHFADPGHERLAQRLAEVLRK